MHSAETHTGRHACWLADKLQCRSTGFQDENVHKSPSWATSRKESMAWYSTRHMPSLWAWYREKGQIEVSSRYCPNRPIPVPQIAKYFNLAFANQNWLYLAWKISTKSYNLWQIYSNSKKFWIWISCLIKLDLEHKENVARNSVGKSEICQLLRGHSDKI
jgi:hypothetical protein